MKYVNHFGAERGQLYVPPSLRPFTLLESLANTGSFSVTLKAVTIGEEMGLPGLWYPVKPAGKVLYMPGNMRWRVGRPVAGLVLGPHQMVDLGFPLWASYNCYIPGGWYSVGTFSVEEDFAGFTHWVAVPLGTELLMKSPAAPGTYGARCLR
jgi:hypothetical protein